MSVDTRAVAHVRVAKDVKASGIAVRAKDTGRVLMLQRSVQDGEDPAAGTWEFPGGKLDDGEQPFDAARREWQEETGVPLPDGECVGHWRSGPYVGHVFDVASEADVPINLDADRRPMANPDDPDGDDAETLAWWRPEDARRNPALRDELAQTSVADWRKIEKDGEGGVAPAATGALGPTLNSAHVDAPLDDVSVAYVRPRRKKRKVVARKDALPVAFVKADAPQQIVYGVALEPDTVDSQGDVVRAEEIEKAAHRYLAKAVRGQNTVHRIQHGAKGFFREQAKIGLVPVESFVAPADFRYEPGGETIRKGSWVLAAKVEDPVLWASVLRGEFTGWSIGGSGVRTPLAKDLAHTPMAARDGVEDAPDDVDAVTDVELRLAVRPKASRPDPADFDAADYPAK